jgi:hypothetical protein
MEGLGEMFESDSADMCAGKCQMSWLIQTDLLYKKQR